MVARQYVLHRLRPAARAPRATPRRGRAPGIESPTVSPLRDPEWVAVRVMIPRERHEPRHGRAVRARRARDPRERDPRGAEALMSLAVPRDPVPRRRRRPRREGRQLPEPARRGRPRRARRAVLRPGRRRAHVPRRHGHGRRPLHHLRHGAARPPSRSSSRSRSAAACAPPRTSRACSATAPTRSA